MWGRARRKWNDRNADLRSTFEAGALVYECESFLDGRYASELDAQHLSVPEWAWLSVLAHSPAKRLVLWARSTDGGGRDRLGCTDEWRQAVAVLAGKLLTTAAATGATVEDLQRSSLVALELDPSQDRAGASDPSRFVGEVLTALDAYRDSSHP